MSESDFIREVDEEIRNEQIRKLWDRFGPFVIGFALLIVVGTAASKGYDYWRQTQAAQSGDALVAALDLSEAGEQAKAVEALEALAADGSGGYPMLAEMRIAAEKASTGDVDEAISIYNSVASDADVQSVIQDLARIRANMLLLDQGKADEVIVQLSGLMDNNAYRHSARELVMLAHIEQGAFDKALPIAERIAADAETPSQMRQRAEIYTGFLRSKIAPQAKETS